ncbi:phosphodiesterase [Nocardioides sp. dk4132]|uniref:phosphodiesterase n=1 Tax=unclassified Nocardioides TaxID=2615069 RepID=UPI001297352A|nr:MULTISPECIES: phosphodiesterase [unclassified Nocardioides]MQW74527.1 phosphodiesterase [Nocardioides sp. dk4132]QGA06453.1 phosphodiesterase [Nocardioides sp. dk884]
MQLGQHPAPTHTVAHLSDPHLLTGGVRQYGVVDTEAGLSRSLERLRLLDPVPQALVFTGDLADRGEPAAYARLRELVEPVAAELVGPDGRGAEVVWVMGNHDERAAYSRGLYDAECSRPQDRVHDVAGLRVVALDTSVPGYHHGELDEEQLGWLAEVLATPAEHGTLLALHHPPVPVPMMAAAAIIELADQHRLAEVIAGTDVRGILGGHLHFTTFSTFAGVPVSVASASCYTSDPAPTGRFVSGVDGNQAFTMVHVYADRLVQTVVPLAEAPEVTGYAPDAAEQLAALTSQERRELLSRKDSPFNAEWEDHTPSR